jgi:hypothetical protein
VFVAFVDNPEVVARLGDPLLPLATLANYVRGMGSVISFPVWQETEIPFPTKLRRKRFDSNILFDPQSPDVLDRSCQTYLVSFVEGVDGAKTVGQFWFHDKVDVEGMNPVST